MADFDYYEVLQVHPRASQRVIQKAYRTLMEELHPDRGGEPADAKRLNEAYEVLSDPEKRKTYDRKRGKRHPFDKERAASAEGVIVPCPACGVKNRVRSLVKISQAICSRCATPLIPRRAGVFGYLSAFERWRIEPQTLAVVGVILLVVAIYFTWRGFMGPGLDAGALVDTEPARAAAILEEQLARKPGDGPLHFDLGRAYASLNRPQQAAEHFKKAVEIKPDSAGYFNLAYMESRLGQGANAIQHYQEAIRLDPNKPDAWVNLGSLHAQRGETEAAKTSFSQAKSLAPDDPEIAYNLGLLFWRENHRADAKREFETALRLYRQRGSDKADQVQRILKGL